MSSNFETILILDFGGQYTQLIGRRIREANVYTEIVPFSISLDKLKSREPKGIVLSGGPSSVYETGAPICAVHQKAMTWVNKNGGFWSCHEKNPDGSWCKWRPPR